MRMTGLLIVPLVLLGASMETTGLKQARAQEGDDDPLAELVELADAVAAEGPEGGGSIRAKKDVDLTAMKRLKDKRNAEVRVESVKHGKFPAVVVTAQVRRGAKSGEGKSLKRGSTIVFIPKFKVDGKQINMSDEATRINAGTFYLQKGDSVMVRLGENKGKYWVAEYVERK